ncbi:MAG: hypothetical protein AAGA90_12755 [Actinomycetota bacterium]
MAQRCDREAEMYQSPLQLNDSSTLLRAAWRYRVWVAGAIVLGLVLGLMAGMLRSSDTTASTTLVLRDANAVDRTLPNENETGAYTRFVQAQAILATSPEAVSRISDATGLSTDDVENRISARHVASADGLRMVATGSSEGDATELLDAMVTAFRALRAEDIAAQQATIEGALDELPDGDSSIAREQTDSEIQQALYGDGVAFSDTVEVAVPSTILQVGLPAIALALLAGAAAFVLAGVADDRNPILWGLQDLKGRYSTPIRGLVTPVTGEQAVAYEQFAAELERDLVGDGDAPTVLLVGAGTSAVQKSDVVAGLCRALADIGLDVAIVGDDQNPDLRSSTDTVLYRTGDDGATVTEIGFRGSLLDFVQTPDFDRTLTEVRRSADIVIIDSPPLRVDATAARVAGKISDIVIVVPDNAPIADVTNTTEVMTRSAATLQGLLVLTGSRTASPFAARVAEDDWLRIEPAVTGSDDVLDDDYDDHDDEVTILWDRRRGGNDEVG